MWPSIAGSAVHIFVCSVHYPMCLKKCIIFNCCSIFLFLRKFGVGNVYKCIKTVSRTKTIY